MDYCNSKNPPDFGADSTQNGRISATLNFCYNTAYGPYAIMEMPLSKCQ